MFTKQQERELCGFALYIENHEEEFKYQLLDRLRCDCKYFLGAGNLSLIHISEPTRP